MDKWTLYSAIKLLVVKHCEFETEAKYDDFIRALIDLLDV